MSLTENLMNNHPLHGLMFGGIVWYISDSAILGIATGGGAYYYMSKYSHDLQPIKDLFTPQTQ